jgi:hypothetical protein
MSFNSISSAVIAAGKAIKQEIMTLVKDNFDDHESRLTVVEAALGRLPPICFDVIGTLYSPITMTEALAYRVEANLRVTAARLFVKKSGTSGSVQVDIQYKRGAGAWTTILTGSLSASYTLGNYAVVTGVLAFQDFQAGDLIRLNISSVQDAMEDFTVYLENESA